jgi:prephenate dehydrogenase
MPSAVPPIAGRVDDVAAGRPAGRIPATTLAGSTDPAGAATVRPVRVAFLGFGLIAGSVARALREAHEGAWELAAWSPTGGGPARALVDGVVDQAAATAPAAIEEAQIVVLGAPASACLDLLDSLAGPWAGALAPEAVVTDVASTKGQLLARADLLGLHYVGGHPMAGRDEAGYGAASADLFAERPWVLVEGARATTADVAAVASLATACGARPVVMDAETHDTAVAAISHLPLFLAASLLEAVAGSASAVRADWPQARDLAASGWRDMTRLANGDPVMGAAIAATNAPAIAARLRDVRAVLDAWLAVLEQPGGPDERAIESRLRAVRARLQDDARG